MVYGLETFDSEQENRTNTAKNMENQKRNAVGLTETAFKRMYGETEMDDKITELRE